MGLRTLERLNRVTSDELGFISAHEIRDSITNHLEKTLNTKKGSVPLDENLGQDTQQWLKSTNNFDLLEQQLLALETQLLTTDQRIQSCSLSIEDNKGAQTLIQLSMSLTLKQGLTMRLQVQFMSDETFIVNEK